MKTVSKDFIRNENQIKNKWDGKIDHCENTLEETNSVNFDKEP